ncbi:MAG: DUF2975 domain-containing protein, partial [Clostridia bacterium]|nr:DUF2975 domain-containing protein [Clostridia bacterium]
ISLFIAAVFLIVCAFLAFSLPEYLGDMVKVEENGSSALPGGEKVAGAFGLMMLPFLFGFAYMMLGVAVLIDILFICLLQRIRKGLVFTKESIDLLRGISFCFLGVALLFFPMAFSFSDISGAALIIFAIALFLGLCVRVIKNVLEEAIAIKSENDLTI